MKFVIRQYDLVIFDVDGTLLNTKKGICSSVKYAAVICGLPVFDEIIIERNFIGPPIFECFKNTYGLDYDKAKEAVTVFREHYLNFDLFRAEPYNGIYEVCNSLKDYNIKMAIATNKRIDCALKLLNYFKFFNYTRNIHGSDFEGKLKKADLIEQCIKESGVKERKRILMVGDGYNDIEGAKSTGVSFLGVTYGYGFESGIGYPFPTVTSALGIKSFIDNNF